MAGSSRRGTLCGTGELAHENVDLPGVPSSLDRCRRVSGACPPLEPVRKLGPYPDVARKAIGLTWDRSGVLWSHGLEDFKTHLPRLYRFTPGAPEATEIRFDLAVALSRSRRGGFQCQPPGGRGLPSSAAGCGSRATVARRRQALSSAAGNPRNQDLLGIPSFAAHDPAPGSQWCPWVSRPPTPRAPGCLPRFLDVAAGGVGGD